MAKPARKQFEAEMVRVIAPLIAEVDDYILVYNGVAIGVDSARHRAPAKPNEKPKASKPSQKPKKKTAPRVKAQWKRGPTGRNNAEEMKAIGDKIFAVLAASPNPLPASQIQQRVNMEKVSHATFYYYLRTLRKQALIRSIRKGRRFIWAAVTQAASDAA
jgi:hypothetical protein